MPYSGGYAFVATMPATKRTPPLLVSGWNQRLKNWQAARAFARLCAHCGITGSPAPRLHDLRHNYACRCLALWRNEDVDALLPVLANAMGHVDFRSTQLYMHIDAVALPPDQQTLIGARDAALLQLLAKQRLPTRRYSLRERARGEGMAKP